MQSKTTAPVGVIDIGSNSVRLVVYDGLKRSPMPMFNEKVLCGLAKGMQAAGCLDKEAVEEAYQAIGRFVRLSRIMQVETLYLLATAAVRDAKDGPEFVARIETSYQVKVTIFSGEEEARQAAMGIISSVSHADGVAGDLGGGSLELISVADRVVGSGISFPIGPVRLLAGGNIAPEQYQDVIDEHLQHFPLRQMLEGKNFYAVGGAFRNMAKVHMGRKSYPLKVLHNYKVPVIEFTSTLQIISRMSATALQRIPYISQKRLSFLPYSALLMSRIIAHGKPRNVVFSASGIREGYLYSLLSKKDQEEDGLIAGCMDMASRVSRNSDYGHELYTWMNPLFIEENEAERRLRLAACILSDISCFENTEYRGELAYRRVLDSSLTCITHKERVFIAKSLYYRYNSEADDILAAMQPLLSERRFQAAQTMGTAMRLARSLSCSHTGILPHTRLVVSEPAITLTLKESDRVLLGEAVEKRLRQLAMVMGREGIISVVK